MCSNLFKMSVRNRIVIVALRLHVSLVTLIVQWVDVTQLEKNATLLFPECIKVSTRDSELYFSMFLNINETFKLMEQLANIAMRQLFDNKGYVEDMLLPKPSKPLKNISALKRYVCLSFCPSPSLSCYAHTQGIILRIVKYVPGLDCIIVSGNHRNINHVD